MPTPIYYENKNKWILRAYNKGTEKTFTCNKAGAAGKREVMRRYRLWLNDPINGTVCPTVKNAYDEYLQNVINKHGKHATYINAEKYGRLYILPAIGKYKTNNLRFKDLQSIINNAKPVNKSVETLSKKTLANLRGEINLFIKYCVANDYMEPLKSDLYIPNNAPASEKSILQPNEIYKLFQPCNEWYINALRLQLLLGLRPSEVLGIQLTDIQDNIIHIQRGINTRGEITTGKNKNARRDLIIYSVARDVINAQLKQIEKLPTIWLFPNRDGSASSQHTYYNCWRRISKKYGLIGSPYTLRHTFISLVKNTMPEQMIKTLVGHSVSFDTFGVYGHTLNNELNQAGALLDQVFNESV